MLLSTLLRFSPRRFFTTPLRSRCRQLLIISPLRHFAPCFAAAIFIRYAIDAYYFRCTQYATPLRRHDCYDIAYAIAAIFTLLPMAADAAAMFFAIALDAAAAILSFADFHDAAASPLSLFRYAIIAALTIR